MEDRSFAAVVGRLTQQKIRLHQPTTQNFSSRTFGNELNSTKLQHIKQY